MSLRKKRLEYDQDSAKKFIPTGSSSFLTADGYNLVVNSMVGTVYEVFPMELQRVQIGIDPVFDRDTRGRSWVILDLILPPGKFVPLDSTGFITKDDDTLCVGRKRL